MKAKDLILKTDKELYDSVVQLRRQMMNLRFQRVSNPAVSTSSFKEARRNIARIKTVVRQKQLTNKGL